MDKLQRLFHWCHPERFCPICKDNEKMGGLSVEKPRDEKGKFLPKRPLEFTWPHFWLEVVEVTVAIVFGSAIYDGLKWLIN